MQIRSLIKRCPDGLVRATTHPFYALRKKPPFFTAKNHRTSNSHASEPDKGDNWQFTNGHEVPFDEALLESRKLRSRLGARDETKTGLPRASRILI